MNDAIDRTDRHTCTLRNILDANLGSDFHNLALKRNPKSFYATASPIMEKQCKVKAFRADRNPFQTKFCREWIFYWQKERFLAKKIYICTSFRLSHMLTTNYLYTHN
jgi:hypothetical protein